MRVYNYRSSREPQTKFAAKRRPAVWRKFSRFLKRSPTRKKILTWIFRVAAAGVLFISLLAAYYSASLPKTNQLLNRALTESTKIYARDGTLLYDIHGNVNRTRIDLNQISDYAKNATIAIEDKNFYREGGVSFTGLARSVVIDTLTLKKAQGGSTITQQFVRNALLSQEKSFTRKIKEIFLSVEMDATFSKNDILAFYFNEIPWGGSNYGIEAASRSYFGKSAKDLNLPESAYLAAMVQAPTYYNPFGPHRDALDSRKNYVLQLMKDQGYINDQQYQDAKTAQVDFSLAKSQILAPHFVFYVQDYLAQKYGEKTVQEGGLKVYTTLDPKLQTMAEKAVSDGVAKSLKWKAHNASLVAIDPKTGQILAMVGSKNYFGDPEPAGCVPGSTGKTSCNFEPNVNVALTQQQPGSSGKPFVYVTAFGPDFKYAPASMLMDVKTDFGTYGGKDYSPSNYNGNQYGPVSMRQALAGSLNISAVKTLALVGVDNATQTMRKLGITSPLSDCGLSLVLGGCEVRLLDHTAAYSVLANQGKKNPATPILKVTDRDGKVLEQFQQHEEQVLDPQAVYEVTNILSDNNARSFIFGSHSPLILADRPVAAKTGTTQENHDGWTMGFTPSLVAGVWAGNNDNAPMTTDAVNIAGPIWHQFMTDALAGTPPEQFARPDSIKDVTVDAVSGKLPTQYTPSTKTEIFADYAVPTDYDDVHIVAKIDRTTGQPATELTPPDQIDLVPYTVFHSEKRDNPSWEGAVVRWALANGYQYPNGQGQYVPPPNPNNAQGPSVDIIDPLDNAIITKIPFQVTASAVANTAAAPGNSIARLDFAVDGELLQSVTAAPYSIIVNKKYPNGQHTISVHAVDQQGNSNDTSTVVTFALDQALSISAPLDGDTLSFPETLTAASPNQYDNVEFFLQSGTNTPKLIGSADTVSNLQGQFNYSMVWTAPATAKSGIYKMFAKTKTGVQSAKITVTLP
jgi:penicillin-binding protein 1C